MKDKHTLTRRDFLHDLGILGGGALMLTSPWLSAFADVKYTSKEKISIVVIGVGSRGQFLLNFLVKNPKVHIFGICDIFEPSLNAGTKIAPGAIRYREWTSVMDRREVDAVVIATPLHMHHRIAVAALDAGKHVFCEKTIAYTMQQTYEIYQKHLSSGKVFFSGQQRLFDPRYIKAMKMIHEGVFGDINAIRTYWYRNGDWKREVPWFSTEEFINWRLYSPTSKGLMTELACHQLQVGSWAMKEIPDKVWGHGAITHWKDERDVYDNVHCMYLFGNGVKMTFDSVISNKFNGLEEQILGHLGTVEPEKGKYYFENIEPAPAFLQLVNEWENKLFDAIPFAGTSWAPETANPNNGEYITGERPKTDGTSLMLEAFVEAVITQKQPANIAEEGYYASQLCLLGHEAMKKECTLTFPDEFKIEYLNHRKDYVDPNKPEPVKETYYF